MSKKFHSNPAIGQVSCEEENGVSIFETATIRFADFEDPELAYELDQFLAGNLSDSELEARILNPLGGLE